MKNSSSKFKRFLFALVGLIFVGFLPAVNSRAEAQMSQKEFSQKSLEGYIRDVVNERNFANFGFKSLEEAKLARLGDPYKVMIIGLRDLKRYTPGSGVKNLLIDGKTLWYPVLVNGEIRAKLEIIEKEGKWIAGEFGRMKKAQKIYTAREALPRLLDSKGIGEPYTVMLIKIPALFAEFLYVESSKGEFFVPAMVQPERYKIKDAQVYDADEVLSQLKEAAQDIDENKVM